MTERGRSSLQQGSTAVSVGPSSMHWDGEALTVDFDEVAVPIPRRVRGRLRLVPEIMTTRRFALDAHGDHVWWPVAPRARVELDVKSPDLSWQGHGYFDTNGGRTPLESTFKYWNWCRAPLTDGAAIVYDVKGRGNDQAALLRVDRSGNVDLDPPPSRVALPNTLWRMMRDTRAEDGGDVRVLRTLEDSPFYTRSILSTRLLGQDVTAVHESLSLDRFSTWWLKQMLPYRMPRVPDTLARLIG